MCRLFCHRVNIGRIAQHHISRIKAIVEQPGTPEHQAFSDFLAELRDDLNPSVKLDEAVEMLAQHVITKPVFDALFEGHAFTQQNPVSIAMQGVLDQLHEKNIEKEAERLQEFYDSIRRRAESIDTVQAKQKLIVQLYDEFFRQAFPKTTERLGIVYTPVEVVDFIVRSVNDVLQKEFGQTLGSNDVHIIDPFTGTGTFITRLLQSGLISREEIEHKYRHEIHANEIVLLAYYIAAINIEAAYHGLMAGDYVPFNGICLSDTFQMYEADDLVDKLMPENSERRKRQKQTDLQVIIGNPPYSVGQRSANDDNANMPYPFLDGRIRDTYAAASNATNKSGLYNSYIRAIRWASDRLDSKGGVVAFVTNAGWIDGNATDGMRRCLVDEFSSLYVFHLRGDQRTSGELSRREGGKIFGSGSRAPIAISVLVRKPWEAEGGRIYFSDIGDYLSREEKLTTIERFHSIGAMSSAEHWQEIMPDEHGDWFQQRDAAFNHFIKIGDKKDKSAKVLFDTYSAGVKTQRDAWCFNASRGTLQRNIEAMISVYNAERERLQTAISEGHASSLIMDPAKISWSAALITDCEKGRELSLTDGKIVPALYRPFERRWLYYSGRLNERLYQMRRIFPSGNEHNLMIMIKQRWKGYGQIALMVNHVVDLQSDGGTQCFPLKVHEKVISRCGSLLDGKASDASDYVNNGITDTGWKHFRAAYPGEEITKEDIFYYVYGLLHSEDYRTRYADNLSKELPRIPCVRSATDFWAFSRAGRLLGNLHINYEEAEPYPVVIKQGDLRLANIDDPEAYFRVEKMNFGGKRSDIDRTTVVYNPRITMTDIPLAAYDYVVNGKPALEWVMERQCVKIDRTSGIVNDANRYAIETMADPQYPLKLFQRVITVSLETMKILRNLPRLDLRFEEDEPSLPMEAA